MKGAEVKPNPMRELYNQTFQFKNDLKELRKKIRGLSAFAVKYGEKFNVNYHLTGIELLKRTG